MTADQLKAGVLLAAIGVAGYAAWRAGRGVGGVFDSVGSALTSAYDAVTGVVTTAAEGAAAIGSAAVDPFRPALATIRKQPVPTGGQSLQRPHATDLPEGSSRAAEMYWSLYPDAVFYD